MNHLFLLTLLLFLTSNLYAKDLLTNSALLVEPPAWVTSVRINRLADRVQSQLEWSIRRVRVFFYKDQKQFQASHKFGSLAVAFSRPSDNTVHLGPKVTDANFDQVFSHELVHVISYQKYKQAIPRWLEEGLANYYAKKGKVSYAWLKTQAFPEDVRSLTHPYASKSADSTKYHYMASQALVEMIAARCDLRNLLRLSVGMTMEAYLGTYCQIKDLNKSFREWVEKKL